MQKVEQDELKTHTHGSNLEQTGARNLQQVRHAEHADYSPKMLVDVFRQHSMNCS